MQGEYKNKLKISLDKLSGFEYPVTVIETNKTEGSAATKQPAPLTGRAFRKVSQETKMRTPTCYLKVRCRNSQDEHYETASRDARVRARQLRKLGFKVVVSPLGPQVTSVGRINMTMLTILNTADLEIPDVKEVRL